jgi:hypothetical protein
VRRGFFANRDAPNQRLNLGAGEELHPRFDSIHIALRAEQMAPFIESRAWLLQDFEKRLVNRMHDCARGCAVINKLLDVVEFRIQSGEVGKVFQEIVESDLGDRAKIFFRDRSLHFSFNLGAVGDGRNLSFFAVWC